MGPIGGSGRACRAALLLVDQAKIKRGIIVDVGDLGAVAAILLIPGDAEGSVANAGAGDGDAAVEAVLAAGDNGSGIRRSDPALLR